MTTAYEDGHTAVFAHENRALYVGVVSMGTSEVDEVRIVSDAKLSKRMIDFDDDPIKAARDVLVAFDNNEQYVWVVASQGGAVQIHLCRRYNGDIPADQLKPFPCMAMRLRKTYRSGAAEVAEEVLSGALGTDVKDVLGITGGPGFDDVEFPDIRGLFSKKYLDDADEGEVDSE